ncbi:MAG: long-chain fatty acid--CoA ligase [Deltaproteobacteria bacterium]|nr:long-chain fatty acid--CoA ligase [Deltaproteobacteria bacterium]
MPGSIFELFQHHVRNRPDAPALRHKRDGAWRDITWGGLNSVVIKVSAALLAEGIRYQDRVNILANTRWEWLAADLGILGAGATCVPIYQSNLADEVEYIIQDSGSVLLFAEDEVQLEKLRKVRAGIPAIRRVVLLDGSPRADDGDWVCTWEDFLKRGEAHLAAHRAAVDAAPSALTRDDLVCLIYTSGTTGRPKGVMVTHDNCLYEAEAVDATKLMTYDDVQLLFLPMAHVFAKVIEVAWLQMGFIMAVAESIDKLVANLGEVRPTMMCAVPRIFERVYSRVVTGGLEAGGLKARLFRMALEESEQCGLAHDRGMPYGGLRWTAAQALVFRKVNARVTEIFGGRLRFMVSGGAPLSRKIAHFFSHAGVKICEGYGLTETMAATCVNRPDNIRIGTVGPVVPGTEVKIALDGEILIRGRGVMKGYWNKPEATREAIDDEGWFHSGDIGEMDRDGFVRITDRKKDIIVTAGGKNVAPQNLENALKTNPFLSQAIVFGDKRKYLSVLLTLNDENALKWARDQGITATSSAELARNPKVTAHVQALLDDFNRTLPSYETLKKFAVLEKDFTVGDELTASLKVKRKHCAQKYKSILDGFYGDDRFD